MEPIYTYNPQQDCVERSSSKRTMDMLVEALYPDRVGAYQDLHIFRLIDSRVDESDDYLNTRRLIDKTISVHRNGNYSLEIPFAPLGSDLSTVLNAFQSLYEQTNPKIHERLKFHVSGLLDYFKVDLENRYNMSPLSEKDLHTHQTGGYYSYFNMLSLILFDKEVTSKGFKQMSLAHAKAERFGDLEEDLVAGMILFSEAEAPWVSNLKKGEVVPADTINEYTKQNIKKFTTGYASPCNKSPSRISIYLWTSMVSRICKKSNI